MLFTHLVLLWVVLLILGLWRIHGTLTFPSEPDPTPQRSYKNHPDRGTTSVLLIKSSWSDLGSMWFSFISSIVVSLGPMIAPWPRTDWVGCSISTILNEGISFRSFVILPPEIEISFPSWWDESPSNFESSHSKPHRRASWGCFFLRRTFFVWFANPPTRSYFASGSHPTGNPLVIWFYWLRSGSWWWTILRSSWSGGTYWVEFWGRFLSSTASTESNIGWLGWVAGYPWRNPISSIAHRTWWNSGSY